MLHEVNKGLVEQLIKDKRIKDENDRWISYVEDEEDWDGSGDMEWDDVSGKTLDPNQVVEARKEEI